jgi:hypothetical protein
MQAPTKAPGMASTPSTTCVMLTRWRYDLNLVPATASETCVTLTCCCCCHNCFRCCCLSHAGAYKGRGRGNAFLNDLCDADVLVHVVDASGTTDSEGAGAALGEGADPRQEVL